jgi:enoyl-CoA hydratase/carnithine racemase
MTDFEFKVIQKDSVAYINLGRPVEGNALTRAMMFQLAKVLRLTAQNERLSLIVIEGEGEYFCKGRDGKGESRAGMTPYEIRVQMMGAVLDVYKSISDVPIPVIAKVHGHAVGFGCALAVACDLTLVSAQAKFSFPEIEHDIPPTMAMCAALGKIPAKALSYLIYSAEEVDAIEAKQLGIASQVYLEPNFQVQTQAFIEKLSAKPRLVLETIKKYQEKASNASPDMAMEYAGTLLALVRS